MTVNFTSERSKQRLSSCSELMAQGAPVTSTSPMLEVSSALGSKFEGVNGKSPPPSAACAPSVPASEAVVFAVELQPALANDVAARVSVMSDEATKRVAMKSSGFTDSHPVGQGNR